MPYIQYQYRAKCDEAAAKVIDVCEDHDWDPGVVNYIFTRIILGWWFERRSYNTIHSISGTLQCVWDEFYARIARPYEDDKKEANGEVYSDNPLD